MDYIKGITKFETAPKFSIDIKSIRTVVACHFITKLEYRSYKNGYCNNVFLYCIIHNILE